MTDSCVGRLSLSVSTRHCSLSAQTDSTQRTSGDNFWGSQHVVCSVGCAVNCRQNAVVTTTRRTNSKPRDTPERRGTEMYDGPTWDNSKSRHFYWSSSRSANENDVIKIVPPMTDPTVSGSVQQPPVSQAEQPVQRFDKNNF